jgi:hypothetical protein
MSDFAIHPIGQLHLGHKTGASLTGSIRSPNSPPKDEWQVAISHDSA